MDDTEAFGGRVAEVLLETRQSRTNPRVKARAMTMSLLAKCPDAKLPEILGLPEIGTWMKQHRITEGQLREALTEARRDLRANVNDPVARRTQRRRRPAIPPVAPVPAKPAGTVDMFGGALIKNGPISDL